MGPSQFELERSLLQKAVRRGNLEIIEKVFKYLLLNGNQAWLKRRLITIGYEECWTIADQLNRDFNDYQLLEQYKILAKTIKNKNAAGLAELAKKVNEREYSAIVGSRTEQTAIQSVANALQAPERFWKWVKSEQGYNGNKLRIEQAKKDMKKITMPGDEAMMIAAAYLSLKNPVSETEFTNPSNDEVFPYWIALDKHTSIGRDAYYEACKQIDILQCRAENLGFLFEGSICNENLPAPFWDLYKFWYLKLINLSPEQAKAKWEELKPIMIQLTKGAVDEMLDRIDNFKIESDQGELFE